MLVRFARLQSQPLGANVIATLGAAQHFLKMHFAAAGAPCIEHLFAAVVASENLVGRGDHVSPITSKVAAAQATIAIHQPVL
jgi:hypothetical protein